MDDTTPNAEIERLVCALARAKARRLAFQILIESFLAGEISLDELRARFERTKSEQGISYPEQ